MQDHNEEYHVEDYMEEVCDMDALGLEDLECEDLDTEEELEEYNLENYFKYIEGLSRSDLIILLKWEIQNRLAMTESMDDMEATILKLECSK